MQDYLESCAMSLQQLLSAVARCIVESAIAGTVHGIRICSTVQQELHYSDAVGANGITQGGDALEILEWKGLNTKKCELINKWVIIQRQFEYRLKDLTS